MRSGGAPGSGVGSPSSPPTGRKTERTGTTSPTSATRVFEGFLPSNRAYVYVESSRDPRIRGRLVRLAQATWFLGEADACKTAPQKPKGQVLRAAYLSSCVVSRISSLATVTLSLFTPFSLGRALENFSMWPAEQSGRLTRSA